MLLTDVNVLIYAYRGDSELHEPIRAWLQEALSGDEAFGVSELVLSGFIRIVTNPRIFTPPSPTPHAFEFADRLRRQPNCLPVKPGLRHWDIFARLCKAAGARGGLVADAYFAALAIESGGEWVTTDRDFSRFPGLRWRHPLD